MSCVFCDILAGDRPAAFVYRDERVAAFLDIHPINPGHLLVVPIGHAASLDELDPATGGWIFRIGQRMAAALRRSALPCEGINLYLADGRPAGQEVPHLHLHVLPRLRGDGAGMRFSARPPQRPEREALEKAAEQVRAALDSPGTASGGKRGENG